MPQLVPFYYINEITFTFIILVTLILLFSKYTLPKIIRLFSSRLLIKKQ
jgi:F-type H+-transporting ATPase subunit 8